VAYRADIEIGVKGTRQLEQLRSEITKTSVAAQSLSDVVSARGSLVQNIQNYQNQLNRVSNALSLVTAGTKAETKAIGEYVTILGQKNSLQQRQLSLIDTEIKKRQELARVQKLTAAGIFETTRFKQPIGPQISPLQGQSSPVNERIARTIAQRKDEQRLQEALLQLELKSAAVDNKKLIARGQINATLAKEVQLLTNGIRITSAQYASPIGPTLPPKGSRKAGGSNIGKGISGAVSNAAIGGAFPLLFGQSGAAAAGGALGGIAGSFLGPSGGFAGSLIGTIIGEKAGQGNKIKELAADIGFSAEQTKMLGVAFRQAGQDFDKFQQSISRIQGLSLSIEDQAKAIQLASTLTDSYGGKIDKVTNAFSTALETGKVTQGTLNQLTSQGIPIQQALADKYKISRSELLTYAKDGKISVQDLIDTLVEVGNKGQASAVQQATAFETAYKQIETAVNKLRPIFESLFKLISDQLSNTFDEVSNTITNILTGIETVASVIGPKFQQLSKIISNSLANIKIPPWLASFTRETATSTLLNAMPGGVGLNFLRQLGKNTRTNATKGRYTTPDQQQATNEKLDSFSALSQLAPSGKGARGSAKQASNDAAREAERVANIVRDQAAITEQKKLQAQYSQGLFVAEVAKDEVLKIQLQREQEIGDISLQYSRLINDEKAKGNSAAVKEAFTKTALANVQLVELKTAQQLKKLELDRKENFNNLLVDLDQELKLRYATTEEARTQLRIAYEMEKLKKTGMYSPDKLAAIESRKQQLAAPKTPSETVNLAIGGITDELTQLLDKGNQAVTIADAIGNSFSNSFKGIISGSMTAREALAGFFQSVADAFLDMAAQIIAKWITMTILNSVLSLFPGGGGLVKSGGSGFSMGEINNTGLGTFNASNSFANLGMRATGGPVIGGTPYIVGEKGPELFMPGRSGTVIPNDALGGGGSTSVVVNVDASGNSNVQGDQAQAKQLGVAVSAAVQAELVKQQRPGGLLAGTRR
jgi:tape measure domain-containing protein